MGGLNTRLAGRGRTAMCWLVEMGHSRARGAALILVAGCVFHLGGRAWAGSDMPGSPQESPVKGKAGLFGVEIGGIEDGFSLTNPEAFGSAKHVGARFIDLRPIWSTLEVQPGVYEWTTLDQGIQNASAVGLPVTITVRFFDRQVPEWLAGENMIDQYGKEFRGYGFEGVHRCPSYWGPQARTSYLRLVEAMVQRYRDNPSILAWQFFYGYNDSFYMGLWNKERSIYDYSSFSQEQYRNYLSTVRGFSLEEVNERYEMNYSAWDEVTQPNPTLDALNVSLRWHDFQDYRMWTIERMFDDIDQTVRRFDNRPLIMYYGGSLHHAAHQLSVYDIGLRLLRKHGGALDVTCFEDPVPAEIGAGIVRSYGVTLMGEAWQVPPPLKDFRRLFFHAFSLGAKSYQLVGSWQKMEMTPDEFRRTAQVFARMVETDPVRARVAGLFSYRSILSHVPARNYINPTLAMIPKLQERQYSLDWHSDFGPLDDLDDYPALVDANSEVLAESVIERLGEYVERGGRLVLLERSGRYALEQGQPDYPLLERLGCLEGPREADQTWTFGKGHVLRIGRDLAWDSPGGLRTLLSFMDWLSVSRPIAATPGLLASVSRGPHEELYATLYWSKREKGTGSFSLRRDLVDQGRRFEVLNLFEGDAKPMVVDGESLVSGLSLELAPHELKVLALTPQ